MPREIMIFINNTEIQINRARISPELLAFFTISNNSEQSGLFDMVNLPSLFAFDKI